MPNKQGVLVAIEGIDGAGKTTQAALLEQAIPDLGREVLRTKEPTDGTWGRRLRESAQKGRLAAEEELELFIKDRREHVIEVIQPALREGKVVLVDRYYFSTAAYQGARGMDPVKLLAMNEAFAPRPDLLVVLDVTPRAGLERVGRRGDKANEFEREADLERAAVVFRAMDLPFLMRIDGTLPKDAICHAILEVLCDGPLADVPRPVQCKDGKATVNDDLWTSVARG